MRTITILLAFFFSLACGLSQNAKLNKYLSIEEIESLEGDPQITHIVTLHVEKIPNAEDTNGDKIESLGIIKIGMFGYTVPYTVKNFVYLAGMKYGFGYNENLAFHRIIKDFVVQSGNYENKDNDRAGKSIFKIGKFPDENFKLKHDKVGRLSMANSGPNTNDAQFFITLVSSCPWLNGKHVVMGQVLSGFDVLSALNGVKTDSKDSPLEKYVISHFDVEAIDGKFIDQLDDSRVIDIGYEEVEDDTSVDIIYLTLALVALLMLVMILILYSGINYKKQMIIDIKDNSF